MNAQVQYRFAPRPATLPDLGAIFDAWVETGRTPPGCRVNVRVWDEPSWTQKRIREELKARNVVLKGCPGVVRYYAEPDLTLCDYDTPQAPTWFTIANLARSLDLKPIAIEYHRTKRGWHLAVKWSRRMKPGEIVAIQVLLGSDRGREVFNLRRVLSGKTDRRWNLLFEFKL